MPTESTDGLDPVARVVARDAIRQLAYRYAWAIDSRDLDALVALFVPDVKAGPEARGREALREGFEEQLGAIGVSILFVGNHIIDFQSPTEATGIVYCRGWIDDGGPWIEQAIQYQDRYRCEDGEWLFVGRRHRLWYGETQASHPREQPDANWPEAQVGRGSLPQELPSWQAFWEGLGRKEPR